MALDSIWLTIWSHFLIDSSLLFRSVIIYFIVIYKPHQVVYNFIGNVFCIKLKQKKNEYVIRRLNLGTGT